MQYNYIKKIMHVWQILYNKNQLVLHHSIWEYVKWHKCCRNLSVKLYKTVDHTEILITLLSIHDMSNISVMGVYYHHENRFTDLLHKSDYT